jgi:hypothetical protein
MSALRTLGLMVMVGLSLPAMAEPYVMAQGLAIDIGEEIDLTYQVVESYDENEKVLAGWKGDGLQYFITLEKLPDGLQNGRDYFTALLRDLRALSWIATEKTPEGKTRVTHVELNSDLNFAGHTILDGKRASTFSGVWSLSGKELSWEYLYSVPVMKEDAKSDTDDIESYDGKSLVIVSRRTGQKRTLQRDDAR